MDAPGVDAPPTARATLGGMPRGLGAMRRALRSGPRREVVLAAAWAVLFTLLLALRVVLQRAEGSPAAPREWLQLGAVALSVLLVLAAGLGSRAPVVGRVVLRVEQAAAFVAITR